MGEFDDAIDRAAPTSLAAGLGGAWRRTAELTRTPASKSTIRVFAASRAAVFLIATYAALPFYWHGSAVPRYLVPAETAARSLDRLISGIGRLGLVLLPLAKWDAVWYLKIAHDGYAYPRTRGFLPVYPLLVKAFSGFSTSPRALLVASYLVSLAAFAAALYLLYRLAELELGPRAARQTLWLIAFFPAAFVFAAPYPESLFLLFSIAALLAARTDRWALAGLMAGLASGTRRAGVLLLIPLALMYLYGPRRAVPRPAVMRRRRVSPRYRIRPNVLWLALAPAGLAAFLLYLAIKYGDAGAVSTANPTAHEPVGLLSGLRNLVKHAVNGMRALSGGRPPGTDFAPADAVGSIAFIGLAAIATAGSFRRLALPYFAYALISLLFMLSWGAAVAPMRYLAVVFPLFMWGALVCEERRIGGPVLAISGTLLGVFTFQFAMWRFVG